MNSPAFYTASPEARYLKILQMDQPSTGKVAVVVMYFGRFYIKHMPQTACPGYIRIRIPGFPKAKPGSRFNMPCKSS